MNSQRTAAAIESIHIGPGINQQACNLDSRLRVILMTGRDIEQRLLPVAAGAGRYLNAGTGLKRQADTLYISLADEVEQGDSAHDGLFHRLCRRGTGMFRHATLLHVLHKILAIPLPVQRPACHAFRQVLTTGLQEQKAHLMIKILISKLAERRHRHHAVTLPGGHGRIRVCPALKQNAGHADPRTGCPGIHKTNQQPQRGIPHVPQLLPVPRAGIDRDSSLQQHMEQALIGIHTGSMQSGEATWGNLGSLPRSHDFVQQLRHLALPAPLPAVNAGILLHHLVSIMVRVIRWAHVCNTSATGKQIQG